MTAAKEKPKSMKGGTKEPVEPVELAEEGGDRREEVTMTIWRWADLLIIPITMGTVITLKYLLMMFQLYTPVLFLTLLFLCLLAFYRLTLAAELAHDPVTKRQLDGEPKLKNLYSRRTLTRYASVFTALVAVLGYGLLGFLAGIKWFDWLNKLGYLPLFLISLPPTMVNWMARLVLAGLD
jgi:hypothetical protein